MEIKNSFTVDAPIDQAWELLTDIPQIAPCLPGAKLTDDTDGVYSGGIKIKVGPVTAEYKGSAEFVEKNEDSRKVILNGKGRDTRGAGNAQALITAQMIPVGDKTQVDIVTDLKVSGKVAQFGRGVMQDVSTKLLGQFAECLEAKIGEPAAIDDIAAAGATAAVSQPATGTGTTVPPSMPSPPIMRNDVASDAVPAAAPAPAPAQAAESAVPSSPAPTPSVASAPVSPNTKGDDDDVLDLGDIGLGSAMAKRAAPAVGAVAGLGLLLWFFRRMRASS